MTPAVTGFCLASILVDERHTILFVKSDNESSASSQKPDPGWILVALLTAGINLMLGLSMAKLQQGQHSADPLLLLPGALALASLVCLALFQRAFHRDQAARCADTARIAATLSAAALAALWYLSR